MASQHYYKRLVMKRRGGLLLYMLILLIPNLIQNLYAQERKQGYQGYVEAGYTIGTTDWREANRIEFSMSHGYQFHRPFFVGIGVGYSSYFEDTDYPNVLLTFADVRYTIQQAQIGRFSPFINMKFGFEWLLGDGGWSGCELYTLPAIGINYDLGHHTALNFSVGYHATSDTGVAFKLGYQF